MAREAEPKTKKEPLGEALLRLLGMRRNNPSQPVHQEPFGGLYSQVQGNRPQQSSQPEGSRFHGTHS